ncbi:hypothetical protein QBA75_28325 [Streptomyces stelliscabiei]
MVSPDGAAELLDIPAGPPLGLGGCPSSRWRRNCRRAACSPSTPTG